jgi:hypothetical protein
VGGRRRRRRRKRRKRRSRRKFTMTRLAVGRRDPIAVQKPQEFSKGLEKDRLTVI